MPDAGIKRTGLGRRIEVIRAARRQIIIGIVVRFPVRGRIPPGDVNQSIHILRGLTVVVVAGADLLLHHAVMALHPPHRVHTLRVLPGRRHRRQALAFLVTLLAVVKLHHINIQARVGGEAKPDAHFAQQAGDEVQIVLAVLHHLLTARILFCEREQKILTAHAVTLAQDFFHDLRDRHILVNGVLVRTVEQCHAWPERQGVAGFIF